MLKWSRGFQNKCNFPNCVGAVTGKHVAMKAPPNSEGQFNNYKVRKYIIANRIHKNILFNLKGFASIVLLAICDSSYRFTYIDVGTYGREGDTNAFFQCDLGKTLLLDELEFPKDKILNGKRIPYFIVGNDAFPLHERIMKTYSGKKLDTRQRIYNDSLGRARLCIEKAIGILCVKWMALENTLLTKACKVQKIISTCCTLHNFLLRESPETYSMHEPEILPVSSLIDLQACQKDLVKERSEEIRNNLKDYINSLAVYSQVSWQEEYVNSIKGCSKASSRKDESDSDKSI